MTEKLLSGALNVNFCLSVYVSGGGVTARLTTGNIRVDNGVIHVTDKMLGFIYQTALEHIQEDARYMYNYRTPKLSGTKK